MERPRIVRETLMQVTLTDGTVFDHRATNDEHLYYGCPHGTDEEDGRRVVGWALNNGLWTADGTAIPARLIRSIKLLGVREIARHPLPPQTLGGILSSMFSGEWRSRRSRSAC